MAECGLFLDGMRCAGCVGRIERTLRALSGVREASVNYTTGRAIVDFDPAQTAREEIAQSVEELGYGAVAYDPSSIDRRPERDARRALARLLVAAFLAGNVMLISAALYIGDLQGIEADVRRFLRSAALLLSLPAISWCALPFWRGAWAGLRRREITMDVPIVLGISIAFGVAMLGTLAEADHLFMDSAAMIVFLILLGRTLEGRARARAAGAVDRLAALTPETALRVTDGGSEEVPVAELAIGDRCRVAAGERIPLDAVVRRGTSEIDESLLTGEAVPVLRRPGDTVTGGTTNTTGELLIEVLAPRDAGTLAALAQLLERAQAGRPAIQQLADRVARVFAPSVVALGALTAITWAALGAAPLDAALAAAAVLIVACPCALGLATPAALTAAVGRAARLGILIKSGEALERCAGTEVVLLDKTGTLTEGRFSVVEAASRPPVDAATLVRRAAWIEGAATHPLAEALRRAAGSPEADADDVARTTRPGLGIEAEVGGETWLAGTLALLEEHDVSPSDETREAADKIADVGGTLVYVARGRDCLGVIGLVDPVRDDARAAVARLRSMGVALELVSGDQPRAVALAASRANIARTRSGVRPEEKVARVTALRESGHRTLMAGDGLNDTAALAAADVGVAMARGSDATLHAADVVIRSPRLGAVADLVGLSRATLQRIRENMGFALAYNAVAIPLAMAGVLHPLYAALAMSLSSLVVTGNAARLLRWRANA